MTNPLGACLWVGAGGFAGSIARYGLSLAAQRCSFDWPVGTLASNALGCLAIGVLAGVSARGGGLSPEMRLALATGFCGGFTTMSTLVHETAEMLRAGEMARATLYAAGTWILAFAAFAAGLLMVRVLGGRAWN
jgi:CrcB protein